MKDADHQRAVAAVQLSITARDYDSARAHALAAPGTALQIDLLDLISVEAIARGDYGHAVTTASEAFSRAQSPSIAITLARAHFFAGDDDNASAMLRWLLQQASAGPLLRARAMGTIADIADRRGAYDDAFQAYVTSKQFMQQAFQMSGTHEPGRFSDLAKRLAACAADAPIARTSPVSPVKRHAFLLGFPRTGTTLLEQCLAGHPDVMTTDELDALQSAIAPYLARANPFAALARANDTEVQASRDAYWRAIGERVAISPHTALIDKMPLNSVFAGFIPALFPEAKIIFAVRDPRDVVFSCFRRRFGMNDATYAFCTLEGSAGLFCTVMELFERTRPTLGGSVVDCRYEDVVRDFRGTLANVCGFIGLDWREEMAAFSERNRQRPLTTVSTTQLARGLYDGANAWRGYERHLAPILPKLAPWLSRFGYSSTSPA